MKRRVVLSVLSLVLGLASAMPSPAVAATTNIARWDSLGAATTCTISWGDKLIGSDADHWTRLGDWSCSTSATAAGNNCAIIGSAGVGVYGCTATLNAAPLGTCFESYAYSETGWVGEKYVYSIDRNYTCQANDLDASFTFAPSPNYFGAYPPFMSATVHIDCNYHYHLSNGVVTADTGLPTDAYVRGVGINPFSADLFNLQATYKMLCKPSHSYVGQWQGTLTL